MWSILAVLTILPSTMAGEPCPDWGDITAGQGAEVGLTHREPTGHIDGMTTGDFNGDGVADLVVASLHTPDLPDRGSTIHVHFGPLLPTYLFTMESLQDDSVTITVSATDVSVGGQLANAGDLDGDGVDDLLVGTTEPGGSFPTGKVWAISLASPIAADLDLELDAFATFTGTNALDRFGVSLAGLGDVNGDGYRDVIIGAPDTSSGGRTENGEALIWYGPISGAYTAAGANVRVRSTGNLHNAGSALGYVGDLQNDGYDDIAVAVPGFGIRGGVMIIDGGPLPPAITPATADHVVEGRPDSRLGSTIQAAGDINHDGAADVWLASSPNSMRSGLHLLLGGTIPPGRSEAPPELIGYASQADDYGVSIATGDFNADGELDLYWASRNTGLLHPYYHYEILHGPFQLPARSSGDVRYNQVGTGGFVPDVAVADINDDGYDDAIRTEPVADTPGLNNVYVDFGGTGTRTTVNFYPDDDADSFGDYERAAWYLPACAAQAGFVTNTPEDCDDTNALINPGMVEDCGETDINCDGRIHVRPDGSRPLWFTDADGDGFGDRGALIEACTPPPGVVANDEDCDDTRPDIHPMAPEICDGVDNDCTGAGYLGGEVRLVEPADRISLGRMHLTALAVGTTRSGERSGEPMDLLFGGAVGI
jgi:hypothetical protein